MGRRLGEDANLAAAPLAQSLSSRPSGRGQRGGAADTPWRLRRSCHLAQLALQLARPSRPNSVHKCPKTAPRGPILPFVYTIAIPGPPTTQAHGPTVYTNAPKRPRGAISTDLCTLLRHRPGGEAHAVGAVTQPPTHTNSRSRQKVSSNLSCRISRVPPRFTPTAIDHDQLLPRPLRQTSRLGMRPSNSRSHPDCRLAPSALAPCVPQSALHLASSLSVEVAPCQN